MNVFEIMLFISALISNMAISKLHLFNKYIALYNYKLN